MAQFRKENEGEHKLKIMGDLKLIVADLWAKKTAMKWESPNQEKKV